MSFKSKITAPLALTAILGGCGSKDSDAASREVPVPILTDAESITIQTLVKQALEVARTMGAAKQWVSMESDSISSTSGSNRRAANFALQEAQKTLKPIKVLFSSQPEKIQGEILRRIEHANSRPYHSLDLVGMSTKEAWAVYDKEDAREEEFNIGRQAVLAELSEIGTARGR